MRRLTVSDFRCFKGQHSWDIASGGTNDRAVWCINGPNGAGKSTICDAFRYLLDRKYQGDLDDIAEGQVSLRVSALIMGQEIEKTLEAHTEGNGRKVPKSTYRLDGRPTTDLSDAVIPSAHHIAQNHLLDIKHPSEINLPAPRAFAELSNGQSVVFDSSKQKENFVFGRHRSCDVLVTSSCVSTRHCTLKRPREPETSWRVLDFGSTNGTKVNGKRMKGENKVSPVNNGDVINFGDMSMTFKEVNPRQDVSIIFRELLREPTDTTMQTFFPAKESNSLTWKKVRRKEEVVITMDGCQRSIGTLSTGEKALVYLSLLLARHAAEGSTFSVLDEVDAKLDTKRRMALRYFLKEHRMAPRYTLMVSHTLGEQKIKEIQVHALN